MGVLFRYDPAIGLTILRHFSPETGAGGGPLIYADGFLYGCQMYAGANEGGAIYRASLSGEFTTIYSFPATYRDGWTPGPMPSELPPTQPLTMMRASDGMFYGTTESGGENHYVPARKVGHRIIPNFCYSHGSLFRFDPSTSTLDVVRHFDSTYREMWNLIEGSDGALYGTGYNPRLRTRSLFAPRKQVNHSPRSTNPRTITSPN